MSGDKTAFRDTGDRIVVGAGKYIPRPRGMEDGGAGNGGREGGSCGNGGGVEERGGEIRGDMKWVSDKDRFM